MIASADFVAFVHSCYLCGTTLGMVPLRQRWGKSCGTTLAQAPGAGTGARAVAPLPRKCRELCCSASTVLLEKEQNGHYSGLGGGAPSCYVSQGGVISGTRLRAELRTS